MRSVRTTVSIRPDHAAWFKANARRGSTTSLVMRLVLDYGDGVVLADEDRLGIRGVGDRRRVAISPTVEGMAALDAVAARLGVSRSRTVELLVERAQGDG